jgi:protease I
MALNTKHIAVLVEDLYEDLELWYPVLRFREAGAKVTVVGPHKQQYTSKHGYPVTADASMNDVRGDQFDALIIPGGYAPDRMRRFDPMIDLVIQAHNAGKIVAAICHGAWLLASAHIVEGRTLTCYFAIRDDLINAGGRYVDREVVRDGNLITSRMPGDLPAFCRTIAEALEEEG